MENKFKLYGDGIHDDYPAIQEMIDSGVCEVSLPAPEKNYLITKPLTIPSNFKLKLPRYAEIKLADNANCFMVQNKTVEKPANRMPDYFTGDYRDFWHFVDVLSPEPEDACCNFEIEGGIWNFNNKKQKTNPIITKQFEGGNYLGHGMFFYNVRNFRLSNMTLKDPVNYSILLDRASYFTVENIDLDFNDGTLPMIVNMDAVHLDGNCHYGVIRNIKGAAYDDLVALNAHEGSSGDITNIEIDGIFAEGCHSAVRLLTAIHKVENISISNIYGTYYQYCIGFTKHYNNIEGDGYFSGISINNLYASKSKRLPRQEAHFEDKNYHFPMIWVEGGCHIKDLAVTNLHRSEYQNPIETLRFEKGCVVDNLSIKNLNLENHTDSPITNLTNNGMIKNLSLEDITEDEIFNNG
ncbi:MAG: hypothetical protein E7397_05080 [Ruminococcaceae bacterium]|nr:hypothetical protein [Oscillospiraceae bacterium]